MSTYIVFCAKVKLFFLLYKYSYAEIFYFCSMSEFFSRLRRLPRSRGFGVQSPADYHFVAHVLRRPIPESALEMMPQDKELRKLARLVYLIEQEIETQGKEVGVWVGDLASVSYEDIDRQLENISDGTYLVLSNLRKRASSLALWRSIVDHPRRKICFDLYSIGVVIPDSHRYPEVYELYF